MCHYSPTAVLVTLMKRYTADNELLRCGGSAGPRDLGSNRAVFVEHYIVFFFKGMHKL